MSLSKVKAHCSKKYHVLAVKSIHGHLKNFSHKYNKNKDNNLNTLQNSKNTSQNYSKNP